MRTRIALVENFGLDFLNFRVPLVKFLEQKGYEVYTIIPDDKYCERVKESGVKVLTYRLKKNTLSPVSFIGSLRKVKYYQKEFSFSIIHSFRLQPNIITSLAFLFNKKIKIINHITGLGFAFSGKSFTAFFYRLTILFLYQISSFFSDKIIVQNSTDLKIVSKLLYASGKLIMIEGSGIDQDKFSRSKADPVHVSRLMNKISFKPGEVVVTFTGRLLLEKGILEFLTAAGNISRQSTRFRFVIAGMFDINNPSCISPEHLGKFTKNNVVTYLGEINEIRELLYITDIFVLPTYREGFPRSVLEAMAMRVAVITTDVPGARDAVTDNLNGLIVTPRDIPALENAILRLAYDEVLRKKLGDNGLYLVRDKYNSLQIFNKILNVYQTI
ncbi:MAG: glycosyltransferase family 4 protein [Bacteroidales bacterium]|nr:glycosyltransferase family 4 protein [Bacteroidales bacterium]